MNEKRKKNFFILFGCFDQHDFCLKANMEVHGLFAAKDKTVDVTASRYQATT